VADHPLLTGAEKDVHRRPQAPDARTSRAVAARAVRAHPSSGDGGDAGGCVRPGPVRARVHHRADRGRARHQRHPLRRRPLRAAAHRNRHNHLRGLRRRQHRPHTCGGPASSTRADADYCSSSPRSPSAGGSRQTSAGKTIWAEQPLPDPPSRRARQRTGSRGQDSLPPRSFESHIGRDLRFIRINGTVVGSLAGLLIYTVSRVPGAGCRVRRAAGRGPGARTGPPPFSRTRPWRSPWGCDTHPGSNRSRECVTSSTTLRGAPGRGGAGRADRRRRR